MEKAVFRNFSSVSINAIAPFNRVLILVGTKLTTAVLGKGNGKFLNELSQ